MTREDCGKDIASTGEKGTEINAEYFKGIFSPWLVMVKTGGKEKCVRTI